MFGATNIGKNNDKIKYLYSGYGIEYDGKGECNFGNDYARNLTIFDKSSSSPADNRKNNFLLPGGGDTFCVNGSFGAPER